MAEDFVSNMLSIHEQHCYDNLFDKRLKIMGKYSYSSSPHQELSTAVEYGNVINYQGVYSCLRQEPIAKGVGIVRNYQKFETGRISFVY